MQGEEGVNTETPRTRREEELLVVRKPDGLPAGCFCLEANKRAALTHTATLSSTASSVSLCLPLFEL
jgi:hypothetical protein